MNIIGTLCWQGSEAVLEYRVLESSCTSEVVAAYLDTLADGADPQRPTVVVLDNAGAHTAKGIAARRGQWEAKGLRLWYLPPYCPHLNLVEGWWRKLKRFLLPRRCYNSRAELCVAVVVALAALGAIAL